MLRLCVLECVCVCVVVAVVKEISAFQGSCTSTQRVKSASHSLQTHTDPCFRISWVEKHLSLLIFFVNKDKRTILM